MNVSFFPFGSPSGGKSKTWMFSVQTDSNGNGICKYGIALDKTQTCNGHCFNDYSSSEQIGPDSQFQCGDNCVPVWKMCRGYSQCEDRSDVKACDDSLNYVVKRGEIDRRQMVSNLSDQHFYCNYETVRNNGEYDTITRVDEKALTSAIRK